MALPRFLSSIGGRIKQVLTIVTSAGAADAEKIPSTNASGVLDPSILDASTTGPVLMVDDVTGQLDPSVMPSGIGAETSALVASEALAAGDIVNIWNDTGTSKVRKADATAEGKEAHGFVLSGFAAAATATVYHDAKLTGLSGMAPGARQYLAITPGQRTQVAPSATGNVVQVVGIAVDATNLSFEPQEPITLA